MICKRNKEGISATKGVPSESNSLDMPRLLRSIILALLKKFADGEKELFIKISGIHGLPDSVQLKT